MPEATCLLSALLFVGAFSACMSACFLPVYLSVFCLSVYLSACCPLVCLPLVRLFAAGIYRFGHNFLHKNESFMPKLLYLCYHFSEKHAYS